MLARVTSLTEAPCGGRVPWGAAHAGWPLRSAKWSRGRGWRLYCWQIVLRARRLYCSLRLVSHRMFRMRVVSDSSRLNIFPWTLRPIYLHTRLLTNFQKSIAFPRLRARPDVPDPRKRETKLGPRSQLSCIRRFCGLKTDMIARPQPLMSVFSPQFCWSSSRTRHVRSSEYMYSTLDPWHSGIILVSTVFLTVSPE